MNRVPVTVALAAATTAASVLVMLAGQVGLAAVLGGFLPLRLYGLVIPPVHGAAIPVALTPLSATLLHAGPGHLLFNLVTFVFAGALVERALGGWGLAILYVVGAYAAAFGQWLPDPQSSVPMIGASGAISAVVGAYALLYGRGRARAIGPIPAVAVHAAWLAAAWIGIQLLVGAVGFGGGRVAIGAHVGGFLAGLALARPLLAWRYRRA